jgi:hypothetical protein
LEGNVSDLTSHTRDDLVELPSDCAQPGDINADVLRTYLGHLPPLLYTINSNRSRYQIVADYAARHDLSTKQVDELVRSLPDYGVRSMLAGSVATLRRCGVACLASERAKRGR